MKIINYIFIQRLICMILCILSLLLHSKELIDLEKKSQGFILETKQIIVPGFPGAFNGSIIRWRGSLLLCFRVRNEHMISTFEMGFVWLDDNFNPVGTARIIDVHDENLSTFSQNQDPRLIIIDQKLYIIYSKFIKIGEMITRRMVIAQLNYKNKNFYLKDPICLDPFKGSSKRWEKNWVPFIYKGKLLLAYSLFPHTIFEPSLNNGSCKTQNVTYSSINWQFGELRGGTPALLDNDQYIAFFHSSKNISTVHSQGKNMTHYFMGAYTFSSQPPFNITRISPEPIVGKNFYNGPTYNTWKPLRVVFPMSCLSDKNYLWVTYGRQDFEIWVAKLDKKGLYKSLIPCYPLTNKELEVSTDTYKLEVEIDTAYFLEESS